MNRFFIFLGRATFEHPYAVTAAMAALVFLSFIAGHALGRWLHS
jgi:hypothetical protein